MSGISRYNNDEALAYGFMMIMLYFGAAVLIWGAWAMVFDQVLTIAVNPAIAAGSISAQTAHATAWPVNVLKYSIPLILIVGFIWAANRAIFKRNTGG